MMEQEWMPLSAAQRSRWFLYSLDPASRGSHNNAFAAVVHGDVSADRLSAALRQLGQRHPMLRARFRSRDDLVEQCVARSIDVQATRVDASSLDDGGLLQRVRADLAQPFDLDRGPPFRASLYARGKHEHVLLLVFDHLVVDGWSYWRLLEELGELLAGSGTASKASSAEASYASYISWQTAWLQSTAAAAQRAYWEECLRDAPTLLQIPTDRPLSTPPGERHEVTVLLSPRLSDQLRGLARRHAGTLYTTLLAAYQILLHRYTGQDEILVGTPMPGRPRSEWDAVVGDFVNPIVLRTRFEAGTGVADVLHGVRGTALRGMKNQDYPFAQLVEDLRPVRDPGLHPFYQTTFVFQHPRQGRTLRALWGSTELPNRAAWGDLELRPYPACQSGGSDAIRLRLETLELDEGIRCDFKFDSAVFDRATIERLAGYWLTIPDSSMMRSHARA